MLERKDLDIFVSGADELVYGMEVSVSSILIPLISRGMYAKSLFEADPSAEKRIAEFGYDPIHEPHLLAQWKFIYNAIFDHARKYNKMLKCYETCSVKHALYYQYRTLSSGSRDKVAVQEALEFANAQWLHFDSEVEELIGIPATYRYSDSTGEEHTIIGFYDLVDQICDAGIKRLAQYLPSDWAKEKIDTYKEMQKEALA